MRLLLFRLVATCLLLAGCAQHVEVRPTALQQFGPWNDEIPPRPLAAGDELELRFLLNPELNDQHLSIGPDGRVTVPLLGGVRAEGFTVAEFRQRLEQAYASKLRVPDLDVVVRGYATAHVYVGGEVKNPGVVELKGPTDVLQGVLMAGGMVNTARSDEVVVIRRGADHRPMLRTVDLRRFEGSADPADDIRLQESDVIFVPKSSIAELDLFVDQYLNQSLPFSKSLDYTLGSVSSRGLF